ncbi:MAG: cytochrome c biogenesis protein CcsA [Lentisphaerae bacterium]|nr:cytochrome c biogenesis protein CcsA [Lentisphaerota bacterium]
MTPAWLKRGGAILGILLATTGVGRAADAGAAQPLVVRRVDPAVVAAFQRLPLQDGGRIKPLDTYARFELLKLHGKRSMRLEVDGKPLRLTATEWLLTTLIYPEWAVHYPTFSLDNSDVITAIGLTAHEKKRDRYSYAELYPARAKLYELAQQYGVLDDKQRSAHQDMIVNLANNFSDFEYLIQFMGFARNTVLLDPAQFPTLVSVPTELPLSEYLRRLPEVRAVVAKAGPGTESPALRAMASQVQGVRQQIEGAMVLHLIPPADASQDAWLTPGDVLAEAFSKGAASVPEFLFLGMFEDVVLARDNPAEFKGAADVLVNTMIARSQARGEYGKIGLEVTLYRGNYFFWSLFWFLLSFLLLAVSWLQTKPRSRAGRAGLLGVRWSSYATLAAATALLVIGITMRCIIRGRPPVTTLYETILFITAIAVIVTMLMEWINRQGIAIALAPILGVIGMFLANKYEMKEATDTMPSMQAVLDTNFWLSTHVTCITIGYAAGLLAGAIGHLYLLGRVFHLRRGDEDFYATVGRMVYGVLCFGIVFSFVGTMLGGIWANYSWGRFWGWDPKENGALMIVLWQLIILHARLGGYVRDFGTAALAILGGCVVAFSWWGVNLLGVGLHSYGFTRGIWGSLSLYWGIEIAVIVLALIWRLGERRGQAAPGVASQPS